MCSSPPQATSVQLKTTSAPVEEEDDDDMDLFGSDDEEDAEAERIKEQRLKEYAEKKAKKPTLIAKSSILLDVKPVCLIDPTLFLILSPITIQYLRNMNGILVSSSVFVFLTLLSSHPSFPCPLSIPHLPPSLPSLTVGL